MSLTASASRHLSTVDPRVMRDLLEQHRCARVDQIKAYTFPNPVIEATDPAQRRRVLDAARIALDEIDMALVRLNEGSFGVCVGCTRSIEEGRLYAVPYARRCDRCAVDV